MDAHPTDQALSSYGSGRLDDGLAEVVYKHLKACPDCQKRIARLSPDSVLERIGDAPKPSGKSMPGASRSRGTQGDKDSNSPARPSANTLPPGLADHPDYEIKRELGRGGMGVVYLAHNTLMGRDEVLKVMGQEVMERPGILDRFLREIRAVAKLRHPNIVTAYSAVRLGESIVFAMEYVEGLDLSKMVKAKGPLPVGHACNFVFQAALGLQHAHEEGLVHRDIKPGNLMLSRKGEKATVKVLDFGLAKATREEKVDGGLTSQGQALGTPDFIAPEQILDAQSADVRADIYSLGATLYYLLTGRPPFRANSLYDIYQAHISRDADPLNIVRPEVPAELAALVAKMMAKDPARRFRTPGEVAQSLTPFFKKANPAFKGPTAEVSQAGRMNATPPVTGGDPRQTQPPTEAGRPAVRPKTAAEPTVPEGRWESLVDFRETDSSLEPTSAVAPVRRPRWVWGWMTVGGLMFGLLAAWMGGVFQVKTPDGVIVLENVPKDSEILVDGNKITFTWPALGKPVEIRAVPGQHKIEVKKDGFKTFGDVVTLQADDSEAVEVRLKPLGPAQARADKSPSPPTDRQPNETDRKRFKIIKGNWGVNGENLIQSNDRVVWPILMFGGSQWSDYDFTVDVRRLSGIDSISLIFRSTNESEHLAFGISGRGNNHCYVEGYESKDKARWIRGLKYRITDMKWYSARVRVRGSHIECTLHDAENEVVHLEVDDDRHPRGGVGFRTWFAAGEFKNIRVIDSHGNMLWEGPPAINSPSPVGRTTPLNPTGCDTADVPTIALESPTQTPLTVSSIK